MAASRLARLSLRLSATSIVLFTQVVLKVFGFDRVYALASKVPTVGATTDDVDRQARIDRLFTAIERACRPICRRDYCVQRAASAATLLRLHGHEAVIVIGVRRPPFEAHAWVEVDGAPVVESAETLATYTVIRRSGPAASWGARARRAARLSKT